MPCSPSMIPRRYLVSLAVVIVIKLVLAVVLYFILSRAPWYALLNKTSKYEEIRKDDPKDMPLDHIVVDVETYTQYSGD